MDHQLGFQVTSGGSSKFLSGAFTYQIPAFFRSDIMFYGSYATVKSEFEGIFDQEGKSAQTGVRWSKRFRTGKRVEQEVSIGMDLKQSKNGELQFASIPVSGTKNTTIIAQIAISYLIKIEDGLGDTQLKSSMFLSPGG